MGTAYSDLYGYIRAVLGDTNSQRQIYSSSTLDQHITLVSFMHSDRLPVTTEGNFDNALTSAEKAEVILEVCRSIVSPQNNEFFYKAPTHSVSRKGGPAQQIAWIDMSLRKLRAARLVGYHSEVDAILQGPDVFCDVLDRALEGVSG